MTVVANETTTYQTARTGFCKRDFVNITGPVRVAYPTTACSDLTNGDDLIGAIVIVDTGDCSPQDKIRVVQQYDAIVSLWGDWPILMGRSAKCQKHNFNLLNIILCVRTYIDALSAGGRIP